jgi:hypothetical protein
MKHVRAWHSREMARVLLLSVGTGAVRHKGCGSCSMFFLYI